MRVLHLLLGLLLSLTLAACGQTAEKTAAPPAVVPAAKRTNFAALVQRLRQNGPGDTLLSGPIIYRDSTYANKRRDRKLQYEIALAPRPLGLQHRVLQLRGRGYPVSYSVVFEGCLVALFKSGRFGCYRLTDFGQDELLERQLNVGDWKRHWLIGEQLVAQDSKGYHTFDPAFRVWLPYRALVPFGQQPKLYEDARYLAYADCRGEFGGTAYFYNKQTRQTHHVGATCANSIWQEDGQYRVLASLGHMMGGAGAFSISNPELLPLTSTRRTQKSVWQYDSIQPSRRVVAPLFDFYGLQLFGALRYQHQTLYLMHWRNTTFLTTIAGHRITIVDPLFANALYTHNPVTTSYGPDLALTNLDFYGLGGSNEVAALLWQGKQLTKIEWGKQADEK